MLPVFTRVDIRVVAPDLIGFGRSDKPADEAWHGFDRHRAMLLALVERLELRNAMLVCQDWGGIFGLTLPQALPGRFTRLLVMNTAIATGSEPTEGFKQWRAFSNSQPDLAVGKLFARGRTDMTPAEAAAYDAPFPDVRYKAALRRFPNMVPDRPDAEGAAIGRAALAFWANDWTGQSFMAIGMRDPVLGAEPMRALRRAIRGCPEPLELPEAGHFVPEWGAGIAEAALARFRAGLRPRFMDYRQTVDFLLHDWLAVTSLSERPRFADHSRETFDSVLDTCEKIAREKFAPFNRLTDTEEPWFDGEKVHLPEASHAAARAYIESGMLAAAQDYELGGMHCPASSRWRPTASSPRPASASGAAAC